MSLNPLTVAQASRHRRIFNLPVGLNMQAVSYWEINTRKKGRTPGGQIGFKTCRNVEKYAGA